VDDAIIYFAAKCPKKLPKNTPNPDMYKLDASNKNILSLNIDKMVYIVFCSS